MKFIPVLLAGVYMLFSPTASLASTMKVDVDKSSLSWLGKKVTGEHTGTLSLKSGTLTVEENTITAANLVVDMSSLTVTDIKDKKYNKKLVDHLASDDFFSTNKHKSAEFNLKEIKPDKGGKLRAFGTLTVKGIEKPINFPVTVESNGEKTTVKGKAVVDRTDFGIKYKSGKFFPTLGDKMIYDDFEVSFNVVAQAAKASPKKKSKK